MDLITPSPFTLQQDVSMDYTEDRSWGWGGMSGGDAPSVEDMYFYDEDSLNTYYSDWKDFLKELVEHHYETKDYLTIREETMEEID